MGDSTSMWGWNTWARVSRPVNTSQLGTGHGLRAVLSRNTNQVLPYLLQHCALHAVIRRTQSLCVQLWVIRTWRCIPSQWSWASFAICVSQETMSQTEAIGPVGCWPHAALCHSHAASVSNIRKVMARPTLPCSLPGTGNSCETHGMLRSRPANCLRLPKNNSVGLLLLRSSLTQSSAPAVSCSWSPLSSPGLLCPLLLPP